VRAGKLSDEFAIIGIDHNDQTTEQWRQSLTEMMQAFTRVGGHGQQAASIDEQAWSWLIRRMRYMRGDFTQPDTYTRLGKLLMDPGERQTDTANVLFYLAVAERFFGPVIEQLGRAGLNRQSERAWRRVIVEKPFGHDLASAKASSLPKSAIYSLTICLDSSRHRPVFAMILVARGLLIWPDDGRRFAQGRLEK
jgi:glucose-6-phosphate 1-dehydrogenase